jgi:ABC-type transport system involved in multi-copper enzyme maturation permease subunit
MDQYYRTCTVIDSSCRVSCKSSESSSSAPGRSHRSACWLVFVFGNVRTLFSLSVALVGYPPNDSIDSFSVMCSPKSGLKSSIIDTRTVMSIYEVLSTKYYLLLQHKIDESHLSTMLYSSFERKAPSLTLQHGQKYFPHFGGVGIMTLVLGLAVMLGHGTLGDSTSKRCCLAALKM